MIEHSQIRLPFASISGKVVEADFAGGAVRSDGHGRADAQRPGILGSDARAEVPLLRQHHRIDIGTDEELDDGPDRLPPVTAFTVTMRARK